VLVTRTHGYALVVEPEAIDAARFERLVGEGETALDEGDAGEAPRAFGAGLAL